MAVRRSYFDNSGDQNDPSQKCISLGGYVGSDTAWNNFEFSWDSALKKFDLPYLHMKEFGAPGGIYSALSDDDVISLLSSLVDVIAKSELTAFGSTVRLVDLHRFNNEKGLHLDGYSLSLHECLQWMGHQFPNQVIETVVDRIDDAHFKIALAKQCSESSVHSNLFVATEFISITPLPKIVTARELPPLQAADFLAWELHRAVTNEDEWWSDVKPSLPRGEWFLSHLIWYAARSRTKSVEFPYYQRRSFNALRKAAPVAGSVWDYQALSDVDEARGGVWLASK